MPVRGLPPSVAEMVRPHLAPLVDLLTSQIQASVHAYAGPRGGRRQRLIASSVSASVHYFVDSLEGQHDGLPHVDEVFRRMGRAEALDGNSLEAMHEALEVATRDAWRAVHSTAVTLGLTVATLGQLGDALFALMEHLREQVSQGHHAARAELGHATRQARSRLVDALILAHATDEIDHLAASARWALPGRAVLLVAENRLTEVADPVLVGDDLLVRLAPSRTVVVVPERGPAAGERCLPSPELVEELRDVLALDRVALSWPVALADLPDAHRWAGRALDLARQGVIEAGTVIHCADHTATLWLHAEPHLRRELGRDVLAPLLHEPPHSREVLTKTLHAWLSSHDSAPVLGQRLGVHAQTVRYRLRRLHALLGDRLDDPATCAAMRLVLDASLPIWSAGHAGVDIEQVLRP